MWVTTDCPEFAERLLGTRLAWSAPPSAAGPPAAPLALAGALLAGRKPVWTRMAGHGSWEHLIVAGRARGSQFDAMAALVDAGEACGRAVAVAETGDGFHGWEGRRWAAAPGNLHLVAASPMNLPAREGAPGLLALPAAAILDAIDEVPELRGRAGIRWVNDIFVDGAKVAGSILRSWSQGDRITEVLVGIGLNVESSPEVVADRFVPRVAALRESTAFEVSCTLPALFDAVLRALTRRLAQLEADGARDLVEDYRRRSLVLRRTVAVFKDEPGGAEIARGRVRAIGDDLSLEIEGRAEPVRGGRAAILDT